MDGCIAYDSVAVNDQRRVPSGVCAELGQVRRGKCESLGMWEQGRLMSRCLRTQSRPLGSVTRPPAPCPTYWHPHHAPIVLRAPGHSSSRPRPPRSFPPSASLAPAQSSPRALVLVLELGTEADGVLEHGLDIWDCTHPDHCVYSRLRPVNLPLRVSTPAPFPLTRSRRPDGFAPLIKLPRHASRRMAVLSKPEVVAP